MPSSCALSVTPHCGSHGRNSPGPRPRPVSPRHTLDASVSTRFASSSGNACTAFESRPRARKNSSISACSNRPSGSSVARVSVSLVVMVLPPRTVVATTGVAVARSVASGCPSASSATLRRQSSRRLPKTLASLEPGCAPDRRGPSLGAARISLVTPAAGPAQKGSEPLHKACAERLCSEFFPPARKVAHVPEA